MSDSPTSIPPPGRLGRTARLGGLVAGQGLRWAGTRVANVARSDERARQASEQRTVAVAEELVERLGQMKGAAMKLGQVLSTVDFLALPETDRERFKQTLAALRDRAPAVPFERLRRLMERELGAPLSRTFLELDEQPLAAASIGQVHRARLRQPGGAGADVVVKVQYPGIAEAVEADLRNLGLVLALVKRLAPGLDVRALGAELRERVGEELDYELEAQSQRQVERAWRGHPFVRVPRVDTALSTRRVLISEYVEGQRFDQVRVADNSTRDRFGEIVFRFFFGLLGHLHRVSGDPHPGNYLLCSDGRVCFLDFGLMRAVDGSFIEGERAVVRAVADGQAAAVHRGLAQLGYLPDPDDFVPEELLGQLSAGGAWYLRRGVRRLSPEYVREVLDAAASPRSPYFPQLRRQTLPPQALLVRRMEGLVFLVLGELRAAADWWALAREQYAGAPPSTPLGELDAAYWRQRDTRPV